MTAIAPQFSRTPGNGVRRKHTGRHRSPVAVACNVGAGAGRGSIAGAGTCQYAGPVAEDVLKGAGIVAVPLVALVATVLVIAAPPGMASVGRGGLVNSRVPCCR